MHAVCSIVMSLAAASCSFFGEITIARRVQNYI
jgi:hypothetical protein